MIPGTAGTRQPLPLPAGHCPDHEKRLPARYHLLGQRVVGRGVGQILIAGVEAHERPTLSALAIADSAEQHRVLLLERVEYGSLRDRAGHLEVHLAGHVRQVLQVGREDYSYHGNT